MDQGVPPRGRRAKAIAISQTLEQRRQAFVARVMMALAGAAVLGEVVTVAHSVWAHAHP